MLCYVLTEVKTAQHQLWYTYIISWCVFDGYILNSVEVPYGLPMRQMYDLEYSQRLFYKDNQAPRINRGRTTDQTPHHYKNYTNVLQYIYNEDRQTVYHQIN